MTHALNSLIDSLSSLWDRHFLRPEKRRWSIGGARANPNVRHADRSMGALERALTGLHNSNVRRRWHAELNELDDRQLDDIGISRADIERTVGRLRFWI